MLVLNVVITKESGFGWHQIYDEDFMCKCRPEAELSSRVWR